MSHVEEAAQYGIPRVQHLLAVLWWRLGIFPNDAVPLTIWPRQGVDLTWGSRNDFVPLSQLEGCPRRRRDSSPPTRLVRLFFGGFRSPGGAFRRRRAPSLILAQGSNFCPGPRRCSVPGKI